MTQFSERASETSSVPFFDCAWEITISAGFRLLCRAQGRTWRQTENWAFWVPTPRATFLMPRQPYRALQHPAAYYHHKLQLDTVSTVIREQYITESYSMVLNQALKSSGTPKFLCLSKQSSAPLYGWDYKHGYNYKIVLYLNFWYMADHLYRTLSLHKDFNSAAQAQRTHSLTASSWQMPKLPLLLKINRTLHCETYQGS